ncbi:MAG TPA: bacillithiol biosynthesis cysteine-adding enzyme BshC [Candidatus Acidoferrales bacterium]|nr:bacillithiol biosynthesis cysteine-adding enzyme BshC [Candidatus Acidoferrales bacterium]
MEIPLTGLPDQSKLYTDYLENFDSLRKYYNIDFSNEDELRNYFARALESFSPKRERLIGILRGQNSRLNNSPGHEALLDVLSKDNALAVVTGQQVGLFCGPLYTLFKTISAIKLADELKQRFSEFEFVPVFWLEGDDHDFEESNHIHLLNGASDVVRVEAIITNGEGENLHPLSEIRFDASIEQVFQQVDALLPASEFKPAMMKMIESFYREGETYSTAFAKTMTKLLAKHPLLLVDSYDPEIKKVLKPVFEKEFQSSPRTSEEVIKQSAELEEIYHVQVKPRVINIFYIEDGIRRGLEPIGNGISLRGTKRKLMQEQIRTILETKPESFSPNVVLRPICQDYLLPTAAYVAGPGEIAYFAQLKGVYQHFGIEMPPLFPRAAATILEHRIEKVMEKYRLEFSDAFSDFEQVMKKALAAANPENIPGEFQKAAGEIKKSVESLEPLISRVDPTLKGTMDSTVSRIVYLLQHFEEKTTTAYRRKNEQVLQQTKKFQHSIFPNRELQERVLNFTYFYNKYGEEFIEILFRELPSYAKLHKVVII